jgi:DNA-binding NtrC family response regulator
MFAVRQVSSVLVRKWSARTLPGARLNVLIVTGDAALRTTAEQMLRRQGHGVTCARHSGHALLACLTDARIDVALVEAVLEDMHGTALAERLRRQLPGLRVVFLAQRGTPPTPGVVVRPVTRGVLLAELEAATSARAS